MAYISRRRLLQFGATAGAVAAGFGGSLLWARQAVQQFASDRVIPLTPWLVNTYLVRGERPLLVDTGFPADAPAIEAALAAQAVQLRELALIFITHGHYDHFGGAATLKASSTSPVSIYAGEAQRLLAGVTTPVEVLTPTGRFVRALGQGERPAAPVTPDITLKDGDQLDSYGVHATVIHTPGHTAGSLSLLVDDLALIGDLLAGNLLYPDRPEYPFYIDNPADQPQIVKSIQRLIDADVQTFFPGHGLPFRRDAVLRWLEAEL